MSFLRNAGGLPFPVGVYYFQIGHMKYKGVTSPSSSTEKPLCGCYPMGSSLLCHGTHQNPATSMQDKNSVLGAQLIPFQGSLGRIRTQALPLCPASSYILSDISMQFRFPSLWWLMVLSIFFVWIVTILHLLFLHGYKLSILTFQPFLKLDFAFYYWFEGIYNIF